MKGSKWDEILDQLIESFKSELLKINRQEIVKFCIENKRTRNAAQAFLSKYKKQSGKNTLQAVEKKEKGNEKYHKKQYEESLQLYTESIFCANKDDECLPLAFSNRSLVLQQMGFLSESLSDIDMALETGYPKSKSKKLILRKVSCLIQLGSVEKAREVLSESLNNSTDKEFCQTIKKELEKIKNLKNKEKISANNNLPEVGGGVNEKFVSASNYLKVMYDENRGRHVVATEDIQAGDVLFVEKPFAYVYFEKGCQNCLKKSQALLPCWGCLDVAYCSPKCREEFWESVHSFECGFAGLFNSVGIAHLGLRIILNASSSLNELKKILKTVSDPNYKDGDVLCTSTGYDSVYNLVSNFDKYETQDLFQYAMTALLLALYMRTHTEYLPADSEEKDLELLTSVIFRHILQLICNGHAITELKESQGTQIARKDEVRCGTSIYSSASMMNHSCEPSIINSFQGKWLVVRAVKPIKKDEEVFNCYGPHARRMKRAARQEILSKQYFFHCKCHACLQRFDMQDLFTAFKCRKCKGPFIQESENSKAAVCYACGSTSEISAELFNKQNKFYSLIKEGELSEKKDVSCSLKYFLESWWLAREIFYTFHKDLGYAADQVARCLATLGEFRKSILFLKCCVRSVEERFSCFSVELADEMKKLGDLITCYLADCEESNKRELAQEGILYYQKAQKIMNVLYGPEAKDKKEIETNKKILEALIKQK